jgi:starvation-inducible DNA-binding protein
MIKHQPTIGQEERGIVNMEELSVTLKKAFADTFAFYLKAHYFHWNVEGPDFYQYHEFFGELSSEVYGAVDPFAEEIRAINAYAPGSFKRFAELTTIVDEDTVPSALAMAEKLFADNNIVLNSLQVARDTADKLGQNGLVNFLEDRLDNHKKHAWFLRSSIKRV